MVGGKKSNYSYNYGRGSTYKKTNREVQESRLSTVDREPLTN
jgi:hypothetical protein